VTDAAAPGWYPDPGGTRAWRKFNGTTWTSETVPYGDRRPPLSQRLEAIAAQDALARYGAVLLFGGAGLLIDVFHHRGPGQLDSASLTMLGVVASAMIVMGHAAYARATYALSHRAWLSALPGANLVWWARSAVQRGQYPLWFVPRVSSRRVISADLVVLQAVGVLLLVAVAAEPLPRTDLGSVVVHLLPAVLTLGNVLIAVRLRDDLAG
jgi:hypothetical protein